MKANIFRFLFATYFLLMSGTSRAEEYMQPTPVDDDLYHSLIEEVDELKYRIMKLDNLIKEQEELVKKMENGTGSTNSEAESTDMQQSYNSPPTIDESRDAPDESSNVILEKRITELEKLVENQKNLIKLYEKQLASQKNTQKEKIMIDNNAQNKQKLRVVKKPLAKKKKI